MVARRVLPPTLLAALVALSAGCGGSQATTAGSPPATGADRGTDARGTVHVAALGDSITAGSPLWDPEPAVRAEIGKRLDERSQFEYWAHHSSARFVFNNCGVFGERTDEIESRLDACVATTGRGGADLLIVQGGINDIAQGAPVATAARNLRATVEAGLDQGLEVAIADVLPWNNGHPEADSAIAGLNHRIHTIASELRIPLLPFHDTLADPAAPGTMRARWTIEGDHPSVAGYRRLALKAVTPELEALAAGR